MRYTFLSSVLWITVLALSRAVPAHAQQTTELLANPGFETGAAGWSVEGGVAVMDDSAPLAGKSSLRLDPAVSSASLSLLSEPIAVGRGLRRITAAAMSRGEHIRGSLRWLGPSGLLREDPFNALPPLATGWQRHVLPQTVPPGDAETVQLVFQASAPDQPVFFDQASLTATIETAAGARIFANQVGYEIAAPKRFVVAGTAPAQSATFRVLAEDGSPAFEGNLTGGERIAGRNGSDWGAHYWRGDFSPLETEGIYTLEVSLDSLQEVTPPFQIAVDLLYTETFDPARRCFTGYRCGAEGDACHAQGDSATGGWHDGAHCDTTASPSYLLALSRVYRMLKWRLQPGPESPPHPLLDEIKWGADAVLKSKDRISPAAQATSGAALAKTARLLPDRTVYSRTARGILDAALASGERGPIQFATAWDLAKATQDPALLTLAQELLPSPTAVVSEEIVEFDAEMETGAALFLGAALEPLADALVKQARNPFGVFMANAEQGAFFFTVFEAPYGNSTAILQAAETVAKAYRLRPKPEYLAFIYDQLNWILGVNPLGLSLMAGTGHATVPTDNAGPGAIAPGIAAASAAEDRPLLDTSHSFSLRTNMHYLNALAHLKRIRL